MSRVYKAIVSLFGALMMLSVGIAYGGQWEFIPDRNADLCFEETVNVANGADPETLSTIYCTRALRDKPLGREDRSALLYNRGIIQQARGDLIAARTSFEMAVGLSKTIDKRNLALAEVARDLGDYSVAMEQYDLLAESSFAADSEDVFVALVARRQEAEDLANYVASFDKAQACASCHGANGISGNADAPTLAGQNEDYLEHALRQYKNGQRRNATMRFQASRIAEADIPLIAHYFATLDGM